MKAIAIDHFGGPELLKVIDLPTPKPSANEVLIKVSFSGVNPVDWKIREGLLEKRLPHQFPLILGWDVSGVISQIGEKVTSFKLGDEVMAYCRKPIIQYGSLAEYIVLKEDAVAKKPISLSFAQAASVPLVSLTAWQALFEEAKLREKETILIHAGAGGVGSMAIQFAKLQKAYVITTASSKNIPYVTSLGADKVIDYNNTSFVAEIQKEFKDGIDVVFDCVGKKTLRDSLDVLKVKGRLVSIVEPLDPSLGEEKQIKIGYTFVKPNGEMLSHIGELFDQKKLSPPRVEQMGFDEVAKAQIQLKEGPSQGKIVLKSWEN